MYGGVRGRKTKVGRKLLRFPPTRLCSIPYLDGETMVEMPHHRPTMLSPFKNFRLLNFFNTFDFQLVSIKLTELLW